MLSIKENYEHVREEIQIYKKRNIDFKQHLQRKLSTLRSEETKLLEEYYVLEENFQKT